MAIFDAHGNPMAQGDAPQEGKPDLRELGLPGTLLLSGMLLEEQNPALQGRRGLDTYKAMGYDPTVAMLLKAIELPIRATQWFVEPADDSEQATALADFIHYNLWDFGISGSSSSFDDTLRQVVTGRNQFGFAPFEMVYRIDNDKYAGKVCIDKFAWRAQWPLALSTKVVTPTGWSTIAELRPGDQIYDEKGRVRNVVDKSPVYENRQCYEVVFSSGQRVVTDSAHEWTVLDLRARETLRYHEHSRRPADWASLTYYGAAVETRGAAAVLTKGSVKQLAQTLTTGQMATGVMIGTAHNYAVPLPEPIETPEAELPIDPWVMGYLLGDGDTRGRGRVACHPLDLDWLTNQFEKAGYPVTKTAANGESFIAKGFSKAWRALGLHHGKYVPAIYVRASVAQRQALLQGLIDSDGHVDRAGCYHVSNTNPKLTEAVVELASSLGLKAVMHAPRRRLGRKDYHHVSVPSHIALARLPRKLAAARHDWKLEQSLDFIVAINPVGSTPVQCIKTDSPTSLFLIGEHMVPTHNTRYKWNVEEVDLPDGGRMRKLISMTQWAPPFYQYTEIPANKLALFVRDMNGENYDGVALLRACYKPWWIRDRLYSIQAVGLERGYTGVPIGKLPMTYTAEMQKLMQDIVQGLRTHERAGAVLREDMSLDMVFNKLEGKAMQDAIDYLTHQILMPGLASFLMLGQGDTGSYALSTDRSELFLMSLNGECNYIAQVMNMEPVIPTLIDFNFPNVPRSMLPKLTHGDVGQRNLDKQLRGLAAMAQWGLIVPDDSLEDWAREMLGAPEREGTLTPEYLNSLVQAIHQVQPQTTSAHDVPRPPIPGATNPEAQGLPGGPIPTPQAIQAAEKRHQLDKVMELQARMPWRRPKGRLNGDDRMKLRATEQMLSMMEDLRNSTGGIPELPSARAARMRRPYRLRSSTTPLQMAEKGEKKDGSLTRPARIAARHQDALKNFIATRGKAQRSGHIPVPPDAKFQFDESEATDDR